MPANWEDTIRRHYPKASRLSELRNGFLHELEQKSGGDRETTLLAGRSTDPPHISARLGRESPLASTTMSNQRQLQPGGGQIRFLAGGGQIRFLVSRSMPT